MERSNIVAASFTGAEDSVDPARLLDISARWPAAEWALLLLFEKEGSGRNPSQAWRERFLDLAEGRARTAAHLCGRLSFERLLDEGVWPELARYGRVQANLNARGEGFSKEQAFAVWRELSERSGGLIIQMHEATEAWAMEFLAAPRAPGARVEVLFDASKGKGVAPSSWRASLPGVACGYAGGLSPEAVGEAMPKIARAAAEPGCWIDMESGVRSEGLFDPAKCERVLEIAEPWMAPGARQAPSRAPR